MIDGPKKQHTELGCRYLHWPSMSILVFSQSSGKCRSIIKSHMWQSWNKKPAFWFPSLVWQFHLQYPNQKDRHQYYRLLSIWNQQQKILFNTKKNLSLLIIFILLRLFSIWTPHRRSKFLMNQGWYPASWLQISVSLWDHRFGHSSYFDKFWPSFFLGSMLGACFSQTDLPNLSFLSVWFMIHVGRYLNIYIYAHIHECVHTFKSFEQVKSIS